MAHTRGCHLCGDLLEGPEMGGSGVEGWERMDVCRHSTPRVYQSQKVLVNGTKGHTLGNQTHTFSP
jgi:hypothetical protein